MESTRRSLLKARIRRPLAVSTTVILLIAAAGAADRELSTVVVRGRSGMVASDSPQASEAGARILKANGNAFDAAVATSLALGVTRPYSTGLGGGGFLVAFVAEQERVIVLDFRETAPAGATRAKLAALHEDTQRGQPSPTVYGGAGVATPALAIGLDEILSRFGTMTRKQVAQPALELCAAGFTIDPHFRETAAEILERYERWPAFRDRFPFVYRSFLMPGVGRSDSDRITRPQLANAIRLFVTDGAQAFRDGPVARAMVAAANAAGGMLELDDLRRYKVVEREPVRVSFGDYALASMPPPSSGGLCIAQALNTLSALQSREGFRWDDDAVYSHALTEVLKHAFADRARWLGDPAFTQVPMARLLDRGYARQLAARIQLDRAGAVQGYGTPTEDHGTSHFCVADRFGNVVAMTETINTEFGSQVVAEPFGIVLNNQMDDFAANPGKPNFYGLMQGEGNAVAPGKRPLSSMSPTLVMRNGKPMMALGASGGPRIITATLQVMLNVLQRDMPLDEAVAAVRLHHQWLPDEIYFDREPPAALRDALVSRGHTLSKKRKKGVVQVIQILPDGTLLGASDPRKWGRPASAD